MILLNLSACSPSPVQMCLPHASASGLYSIVRAFTNIPSDIYYLSIDGKPIAVDETFFVEGNVEVVPKLSGGKGGFGSMLRAIGAQIEKTTNREACRDLSGRRLRDINEEQRLKNWIAQQRERERDAEEKHKKKLEKLAAEPKHEFKDEEYEHERLALTEKLFESVEAGFDVALKRPSSEEIKAPAKKKVKKYLMCSDEELSSSDESDSETSGTSKEEVLNKSPIEREDNQPLASSSNQIVKAS